MHLHSPQMKESLHYDARKATQNFWPELWDDEERALAVLRKMRDLLRRFWSEQDERARDWYIHRAREYYQSLMIQREIREHLEAAKRKPTKEEALNAIAALLSERDKKLDKPPMQSRFEDALFKLQERANKRSLAPLKCRYEKCLHPYSLRSKERREFCTSDCFRQHKIDKALKAWHKHKHEWRRPKTK